MEKEKKKDVAGSTSALKKRRVRKTNASAEERTKTSSKFRISAKKLFLTYSQCPLEIGEVYEQLMRKLALYDVKEYLLVLEQHEDGGKHFHVLISCDKKIDRKGASFLDLEFISNGETKLVHGSYERCKSEEDTIQYLTKDLFKREDANDRIIISEGYNRRLGSIYQYLSLTHRLLNLAEAGEVGRAMELLRAEDPERYLYEGSRIERRLKEIHLQQVGFVSKYPLESFIRPPQLDKALDLFKEALEVKEPKVFVVQGPPGCGKSRLLSAIFEQELGHKVLYINHIEGLKDFIPEVHSAIIFDDPDFRGESRERIIQILDSEMQKIKIRYTVVTIPAEIAKAISCNFPLEQLNPAFKDQAVKRRMIECVLEENVKLFDVNKTYELDQSELSLKRKEHQKRLLEYRASYSRA